MPGDAWMRRVDHNGTMKGFVRDNHIPSPPWQNWGKQPSWASVHTYLFLLLVEVVNNNADKEVQGEERAEDDKNHEVEIRKGIRLKVWLLIFLLGTF